jgi:hypothetical protein
VDFADLIQTNLLSPMVLAFVLGLVAAGVKSDLRVPDAVYTGLSIYLLFAIGLKGGLALSQTDPAVLALPAVATLVLGAGIPFWSYLILRRLGRFDVANAAALAAHYGSVSAVTFGASQTFLDTLGLSYEGYLPTLVALLEVPGILVALALARRQPGSGVGMAAAMRELLVSKSMVLLIGGLVIGALAGPAGVERVAPVFITPFQGVLVLFLLELGVIAGARLRDLRQVGPFLLGFGMLMPIVHALLGITLGRLAGMSVGGSMILGVLASSASYIAAPAAVRLALPEANPSYYLTAALVITFPFNLIIGLPLYYQVALWWGG